MTAAGTPSREMTAVQPEVADAFSVRQSARFVAGRSSGGAGDKRDRNEPFWVETAADEPILNAVQAQSEREPRLLAEVIRAWRADDDLPVVVAQRVRRICLVTTAVLGPALAAAALSWAEFSPYSSRESGWLALLSLLFATIARATPAVSNETSQRRGQRLLWAAMLLLGATCALVMVTSDAHIGFPTGALLGAGSYGLWHCTRRSRNA
jgi:hypothetical protein